MVVVSAVEQFIVMKQTEYYQDLLNKNQLLVLQHAYNPSYMRKWQYTREILVAVFST